MPRSAAATLVAASDNNACADCPPCPVLLSRDISVHHPKCGMLSCRWIHRRPKQDNEYTRDPNLETTTTFARRIKLPFQALLAGTLKGQVAHEGLNRCLCFLVQLRVLQGQIHSALEPLVAVRELLR